MCKMFDILITYKVFVFEQSKGANKLTVSLLNKTLQFEREEKKFKEPNNLIKLTFILIDCSVPKIPAKLYEIFFMVSFWKKAKNR